MSIINTKKVKLIVCNVIFFSFSYDQNLLVLFKIFKGVWK